MQLRVFGDGAGFYIGRRLGEAWEFYNCGDWLPRGEVFTTREAVELKVSELMVREAYDD